MSESLLYISPYLPEEIRERYERTWHSRAGLNEMQGTIRSLQTDGWDVTVVSPVIPGGDGFDTYPVMRAHDEDRDTDVVVPPTATVFGLKPVNYAITVVFTLVYTVLLYAKLDETVTVSYNLRPETAVPGLLGKYAFGSPYVLQYEDGLFVHRSRFLRLIAETTKRLCNNHLDGAVCTNRKLEQVLTTDNTAVVRGYPSIGMPETLPDPDYADPDHVVVMFAGHFDRVRGIDRFLDIATTVDVEGVRFWISGTGYEEQKHRVRDRVQQLDDDRITYFGTLPWEEYRTRIVSADILVNFQSPEAPISEYTFPSKLLDFMSAERVVVSTDMSDLAEALDDQLVIGGRSTDELRSTMTETIEQYRADKIDTGSHARDWVEANCTHEHAGAQYGCVLRAAATH